MQYRMPSYILKYYICIIEHFLNYQNKRYSRPYRQLVICAPMGA
jgi:hypothetical protein